MLILLDAEPFEAVIRGTSFLIKPLDVEERRAIYRECVQAGQLGAGVAPDEATLGKVVFERAVKGWSKWWMHNAKAQREAWAARMAAEQAEAVRDAVAVGESEEARNAAVQAADEAKKIADAAAANYKACPKIPFPFTPENFQLALKKIDQAGLAEIFTAACSSASFLEIQAEIQGKS
jgi:hypothetical protein